jgi:hypothetical protein
VLVRLAAIVDARRASPWGASTPASSGTIVVAGTVRSGRVTALDVLLVAGADDSSSEAPSP